MSQVPPTELRPGYLVKQVQQLLRRACDAELRECGLSVSQYAVMQALADHPGASSAELARRCFVTRQSLQDVLGGLRTAGLVTVAAQASHGRVHPVHLTAVGRRRLAVAAAAMDRAEERMLHDLSRTDRDRLATLLMRCAANLDDRPTSD
jgi:DNA-binding MarR family transcriptional regulator